MIAALLYLQLTSLKNRLTTRVRRLKQPKYLLGFIAGGLYFYFYFFRFMFSSGAQAVKVAQFAPSPESAALFATAGAVILFLFVLSAWVLPRQRTALAFTEAEVAFLFPAPISRRTLIHFKLLKSQAGILFTTLVFTLLSRRFGSGGSAWIHAAGWWLVLSMFNLHTLGSSFAISILLERGFATWQRRLTALVLVAALVVVVIVWSRGAAAPTPDDLLSFRAFGEYLNRLTNSGPAQWVLFPFRLVVQPYFAVNWGEFFRTLGPVVVLMALHYFWVIRSNFAFEEASVELARRRSEAITAARQGRMWSAGKKPKVRRAPFALRPTGPAPVALLWKNLIAAGQMFTMRFWIFIAVLILPLCIVLGASASTKEWSSVAGMLAGMLLFWSLLAGPQMMRQDLRQDLAVADVLKLYPLRGWQVVLGELLAPAAILTGIQWLLLLAMMLLFTRVPGGSELSLVTRAAIAVGAATVAPFLNLISFLVPNAAVLLFPAWFQTGRDSPQGIEATGQRLIFALGQFLVFVLALVPAAIAGALVYFGVSLLAGLAVAVPAASGAAALVLAVEAGLAIGWLGRLFERFDLSAE